MSRSLREADAPFERGEAGIRAQAVHFFREVQVHQQIRAVCDSFAEPVMFLD